MHSKEKFYFAISDSRRKRETLTGRKNFYCTMMFFTIVHLTSAGKTKVLVCCTYLMNKAAYIVSVLNAGQVQTVEPGGVCLIHLVERHSVFSKKSFA